MYLCPPPSVQYINAVPTRLGIMHYGRALQSRERALLHCRRME